MNYNENEFMDALRQSVEKAGGRILSEREFNEWLEQSDAYRNSNEAKSLDMLQEALLDYYLEKIAKYKFTSTMTEISGFGGSYEKGCRAMLDAGLQWWDSNPNADPKFQGMRGVYGIIKENNQDAKDLSSAVLSVTDGATGAMHQSVISHCMWIKNNGWKKYVEEMSKEEEQNAD